MERSDGEAMTDEKTPEQRAKEYAAGLTQLANDMYEAGRADFIKNELPKLLEKMWKGAIQRVLWMNREQRVISYHGTGEEPPALDPLIASLLAIAEKGEI